MKRFIALKFKDSKLKNADSLSDQIGKVCDYLAKRMNIDEKKADVRIGTVDDDFIRHKVTLILEWEN